jgi:hypothetical protein
MSTTTYTIGRSTGQCAASGRVFEPGERYVATLCEREDAGEEGALARVDFSSSAWASGARPGAGYRLVGSWRAGYVPGESRRAPILDDEAMLDLLQTMEPGEGRRDTLRFVLALMLVRRRVLIPEPAAHGSAMRLRVRGTGGSSGGDAVVIEVQDPGLDEAAVGAAIEELQNLGAGDGGGDGAGVGGAGGAGA